MAILLTKIKTIFKLGVKDILIVLWYRVRVRSGMHPACRIASDIPSGPFFYKSLLPPSGLPSVSTWIESASLFGYINIPLKGLPPKWLANPVTGDSFSIPLKPWWKISDFDEITGDIKLIWEQSRMDWVVAFAQRARNGDEESLIRLNAWLVDWMASNPPYLGPNWKCGQEASIRVIHLCCATLILGQEKHSAQGLNELIRLHLRRISSSIHYAIAQNNNHGTSEAAALFIGGSLLSSLGWSDGERWANIGRFWLENRTKKLIENDGTFSQYSLNYHRMALDTLSFVEVWRRRLELTCFSPNFYRKSSLASLWLYQMIFSSNGNGPNLGANDGSHLLQLTNSSYTDYRPSVQLAMALFEGRQAYTKPGCWNFHLAWLGISEAKDEGPEYLDCDYDEGGYKILRLDDVSVILRYPRFHFRPSQADALHLDLWINGVNILRDAGSYSYNSVPDLSWYFSGTAGHNTIQFDERDQMPRLSRFLFGSWLKVNHVSSVLRTDSMVGCSVGYRDSAGAAHLRTIQLHKNYLSVVDEVKDFEKKAVLRWRLPDGVWDIKNESSGVSLSHGGSVLTVKSDSPIVCADIVEGRASKFYMETESTTILEVEINRPGTFTTEYRWTP